MKQVLDLIVKANIRLHDRFVLLELTSSETLPKMYPGQFAEIRIDHTPSVLLRRPISIHYYHSESNEVGMLIQLVGDGTRWLSTLKEGDTVNAVLPLGNGFTLPVSPMPPTSQVSHASPISSIPQSSPIISTSQAPALSSAPRCLLIGGGVGVAPLFFLGESLKERGIIPSFLLGSRTENDLLRIHEFKKIGPVYVATENGLVGEKGFVTQHSLLQRVVFDQLYACGPKPMMQAVAAYAKQHSIPCEVSLENTMACGVGACLCCVEKTTEGHLCVCKEGPVFSIDRLLW